MLTRENKTILTIFVLFSIVHWIFFSIIFFGFHDVIWSINATYPELSNQEKALLLQNTDSYQILNLIILFVNLFAMLIYGIGFNNLLYTTHEMDGGPLLPLTERFKQLISGIPILLVLCVSMYVNHGIRRCYLWMEMIPIMVYSLAFLASLVVGFCGLRKQSKNNG